MPKEFRSLIPLEEAKSIVLDHAPRTVEEAVPLERARGAVLAEKIISAVDVPGFSRASMDGYAVHAADILESREDRPVRLRLAGSVPMGASADVQVAKGEAVEVSTGSMMPPGADAVVMIEYSQHEGDEILIRRPVHAGENVQAAGSDIALGEAVLFPGTRLAARELGVLAALGREKVKVRSLRVGVASTGNELVPPGRLLGPGQIYDINSYSIAAAAEECQATAIGYGILPDRKEEMSKALQEMANECGLILVSGSTSAGAGDMIYQVLDEIGETIFHGVNLKPGKPTIFGLIDGTPCLGLPGYPASALTVFGLLAAPAIQKALGLKFHGRKLTGRLARPVRSESRQQMLAVGVFGGLVYPVDKGSGSITTLARADGVIEIPADVEYLEKGDAVEVLLFGELEAPDLVVAGENSVLLEKLAETLPFRVKLLNVGSASGMIRLEDGLADLAVVSGPQKQSGGITVLKGFRRELGLIFKDARVLQDIGRSRMVGWPRNSAMRAICERVLKDQGISDLKYVRLARTHSAVATAVASGQADFGFGEKEAAEQAGLGFQFLTGDEIHFLADPAKLDDPALKSFISALQKS
ncbi:MAG: molybdopterin biosynthesis protein [Methanothrix sp.]|nr:molybdopterin biosynthesis protein [Methanothrix sp.]